MSLALATTKVNRVKAHVPGDQGGAVGVGVDVRLVGLKADHFGGEEIGVMEIG